MSFAALICAHHYITLSQLPLSIYLRPTTSLRGRVGKFDSSRRSRHFLRRYSRPSHDIHSKRARFNGLYFFQTVSCPLIAFIQKVTTRHDGHYHTTHSTMTNTPQSSPPLYIFPDHTNRSTPMPMHFPKTPPRVAVVLPQDEQMEMGRYRNPRGYSEWW